MAAAENEIFRQGGVVGAEGKGSIVHVLMEERWVVFAGGGYRGNMSVDEEIRGGGGGSSGGCFLGGLEAGEVIDGGAYGGELVDEVVRNRGGGRGFGLDGGGEVVEGENVGGNHG